jgi:diguanylate cyclase (GGDEF)-like protein
MSKGDREFEYYKALAEDLGARVFNLRNEQTRARRQARRADTLADVIRRTYRLDQTRLSESELATEALKIIQEGLMVDRAALLQREHARGKGRMRPVAMIGLDNHDPVSKSASRPPAFVFSNTAKTSDPFADSVASYLGVPHCIWVYDDDSQFALALGNQVEDQHIKAPFGEQDASFVEALLEIFVNVARRQDAERRSEHDALHDALTGLPNRSLFIEHLNQAMGRSRRAADYIFSVLFIDLDRFKLINDSLGHVVGDELLRAFSERLRRSTRSGDVVSRLGGDEFGILADDINDMSDVMRLSERIHEDLKQPFKLAGQTIFVSASIGIAKSAETYDSGEELMRDADLAMYSAKELGGGEHKLFDTDMHQVMVSKLELETDLRSAVGEGQLRLNYLPTVDLSDGQIFGFESLVRWRHPRKGLTMPDEFIPMAEETGLILQIGQWVQRKAAEDLVAWRAAGPEHGGLTVAVNVSDREFLHPRLAHEISEVLATTGLPGSAIELELTERMLMHADQAQTDTLERLRKLDLSIAIDDFGTGYSSLSRLQNLPIDKLKIDRSFVEDMEGSQQDAEIVRTIIALAHSLDLKVVAEGVETEGQLRLLMGMGCNYAQGFLFSKAVDAEAVDALLKRPRFELPKLA